MNSVSSEAKNCLRQTVSGLFYSIGSNGVPLIGIHWPIKAKLAGEANLSPVAGEWKNGESAEEAMVRQVAVEYGRYCQTDITPLSHRPFTSTANLKQYHWLLVRLLCKPGHVSPQATDVASFGWYEPSGLQYAINQMHQEKQGWFKEVLKLAIKIEPVLIPFGKKFG